jgi:tripartite-type tricarboxylate transporter receptor subunit TctC
MASLIRAGALALAFLAALASVAAHAADAYPTRIVKWVVGYPAGGSTDIFARLIGQRLAERLGQPVVIENKAGAANNIATDSVVKAAPDGYTLLLVNPANAINASLYKNLTFNVIRDIAPIAGIARVPNVMEVHPGVPARTVAEFIAYAKANPGKINWATSGTGTSVHLTGELFRYMTGVDMLNVPYRGSAPALADMLSGQVHVMFDNLPSSIGHIRAGGLRALAVTTAERSAALPDVPTVAETIPGFEASAWFGAGAPKGTPPEVIARLNKEINETLAEPRIQARIAELGGVPIVATPAQFGDIIKAETEKWAKVVEFSGAKPD